MVSGGDFAASGGEAPGGGCTKSDLANGERVGIAGGVAFFCTVELRISGDMRMCRKVFFVFYVSFVNTRDP